MAGAEQNKWGAPTYQANVGGLGGALTHETPQGLDYMMSEDHIDMIGICEMDFKEPISGQGGEQADWGSFQIGADVEMSAGGSPRKAFKGTIAAIEFGYSRGRKTCKLKCMDPLAQIMSSRETKTWEDATDADIVNEILGKYGVVGQIDSTEGMNPYAIQRNESDYECLRRLASQNGYILSANEGKIDFKKPQFELGESGKVAANNIISLNYSQNNKNVPQSVEIKGWDYNTKKVVEASAGPGDIQGIGGGGNGSSMWGGSTKINDVWVNSQEAAKRMATAEMNRLARQYMRGRATIMGDGAKHSGLVMKFEGQDTGFNADVFAVSARHRISNRAGYVSEISFCGNTKPT